IRLDPHRPQGYSARAEVWFHRGQVEAARADLREAIRLEVDHGYAVVQYVAKAPSLAQRKEALAFVAEELRRQGIFSDALSAYRDAARGVLSSDEVLGLLREAHNARPDLWQAWSVLVNQLIDMGQHAGGLELAQQATDRFPLCAHVWVDLAGAERA